MSTPRMFLIVSDLHLSEGWDERTKRLSRIEDFYFDASFARFLSAHAGIADREGYRLRLILAGDQVDFLQVVSRPSGPDLEGVPITHRDREYGLGTQPAFSRWKLHRILDGHWIFYGALAQFVAQGHDLIVLPGNHDIEWLLPEVQADFISDLAGRVPEEVRDGLRERVRFLPWFYLEPGLVYVEHGHQYDRLNSFDYFLHPYLPQGTFDLPAGSFFVRYLFNRVELNFPFADNMKPPSAFLRWIFSHPGQWRHLGAYVHFLRETIRKAGPLSQSWCAEQETREANCLAAISAETGLSPNAVQQLRGLWVPSAIHHLSRLQLLRAFVTGAGAGESLAAIADRIGGLLGVRYVVFGHTHEADLQCLSAGPPGAEYVNSGTWTKVFASNFEERLLIEENEFAYVLIDRYRPKIELLRWRDDLGRGERVRLFQSPT